MVAVLVGCAGARSTPDPAATNEPSSARRTEVTPTAQVTVTPEPTPTTRVTATPEPTPTTQVTVTPEPTPTVQVTVTPEPTPTTQVTVTPEPTPTTQVTVTPEPTPTAQVTVTPEPTPTAQVTVMPDPTPTAQVTATPEYREVDDDGYSGCDSADIFVYPDTFLEWTPDGRTIIFPFLHRVMVVHSDGSRLRMIAQLFDTGRTRLGVLGFHGDISQVATVDRGVIFPTCHFSESYKVGYEIATVRLDGGDYLRITDNAFDDMYPVWSPIEDSFAVVSAPNTRGVFNIEEGTELALVKADGSTRRSLVRSMDGEVLVGLSPPVWSPDGRYLAFLVSPATMSMLFEEPQLLYTVNVHGGELQRVGETISVASWSPDGQYLAFGHPDPSAPGVYVSRPDGSDLRLLAQAESVSGRTLAPSLVAWSPDGDEIAFVVEDDRYRFTSALYIVRSDGSGLRHITSQADGANPLDSEHEVWIDGVDWSPDGARLAVYGSSHTNGPSGHSGLFVLTVARDASDVRVIAHQPYTGGPVAAAPVAAPFPADPGSCAEGVLVPARDANPALVADCEALLKARDTLAGGALLLWGRGPISGWEGVTVEGTPLRVKKVNLRGYTLTGSISPALGQLEGLVWLDLSYNALSGAIPPELGNLVQLRELLLSNSRLDGDVPHELVNLVELTRLDVRDTGIGCVPAELRVPLTGYHPEC